MDASQYKDYVLVILFIKYISDKAKDPSSMINLPEGCSFADCVAARQRLVTTAKRNSMSGIGRIFGSS